MDVSALVRSFSSSLPLDVGRLRGAATPYIWSSVRSMPKERSLSKVGAGNQQQQRCRYALLGMAKQSRVTCCFFMPRWQKKTGQYGRFLLWLGDKDSNLG